MNSLNELNLIKNIKVIKDSAEDLPYQIVSGDTVLYKFADGAVAYANLRNVIAAHRDSVIIRNKGDYTLNHSALNQIGLESQKDRRDFVSNIRDVENGIHVQAFNRDDDPNYSGEGEIYAIRIVNK